MKDNTKGNTLALYDSRARTTTQKRAIYTSDPSPENILKVWELVLKDEVDPEDAKSYLYLGNNWKPHEMNDACVVFNDYWAEYGWYLTVHDDEWTVPNDCEEKKL
jgi:hypothetical protein